MSPFTLRRFALALLLAPLACPTAWLPTSALAQEADKPVDAPTATSPTATSPPAAPQPAAGKPAEAQPADAKPAEAQPADAKPAETQSADSKPAETKPAETKPAETKPADEKKPENKQSADPASEEKANEEDLPAGHSYHGEAFNEGPRQKAYLMDGMPAIDFPITTASPEAHKFFLQGLGQVHGFWYFEAERSFRQASALDPDCAMHYWGLALANANNEKRAKDFIAEAVKRKSQAGERERMYIDALDAYLRAGSGKKKERAEAYVKALEEILYKYPDDVEAKAFLALQLWGSRGAGVPLVSYLAVDALLEQVFQAQPMHPAHHYRIHLWDAPRPEKAVASSALCGQTSPGIAHMWHMPGHIYSRLKRYEDACWQQEASARVDHAHMMRDRVLPDQIHNFAHNNEWLIRNLNHVGRVSDAIDLAKNMIELPRHPKYNMLSGRGSSNYGRSRLLETLTRYELWDDLVALSDSPYLEPTDDLKEQVNRLRHLGRAQFLRGEVAAGQQVLAQLQQDLDKLSSERDKAVATAEEKVRGELIDQAALDKVAADTTTKAATDGLDETQTAAAVAEARAKATDEQLKPHDKKIEKAKTDARNPFNGKISPVERAVWELQGLQQLAQGQAAPALELLQKAGGVDPMFLASVQLTAGQQDAALQAADKHVKSRSQEVQPLALQVDLLWRAGKQDEARQALTRLREMSGSIDLISPVFQRLAPVAESLQWPTDWRIESVVAADVGQRPSLDALGPFRWQPSPAADWIVKDSQGETRSLKQFQDRPVVVIFYLGFGCLHCVEQLQAFAPKMAEFEKQGIALVAIGSDDLAGLQKSLEDFGKDKMPIPLMADPDLTAFKAYRAYDDFEQQPLHGTFLIDREGRVRWQDISYEPFMNVDFLLKESQRLLYDPAAPVSP